MGKGTSSPARGGRLPTGRWLCVVGAGAVAAGLLAACGSSPGAAQASSRSGAGACPQVSAVLSDGPDPSADPVGYALAQVLPLRRIDATSDAPLQHAIENLASAYDEFYRDKGVGAAARSAVTRAGKQVDALCPGVAS